MELLCASQCIPRAVTIWQPSFIYRRATCSVRDRLEIMYMNEGWHVITARGMHCKAHSSSI
jgi:hypothetical protein